MLYITTVEPKMIIDSAVDRISSNVFGDLSHKPNTLSNRSPYDEALQHQSA